MIGVSALSAVKTIRTICNEGCNEPFEIHEMPTTQLTNKVEKTYFTCSNCNHEYVIHYTDPEIRQLQEGIRKVLGRRVNPNLNIANATRQEKRILERANELKKVIAEKMELLKQRVDIH